MDKRTRAILADAPQHIDIAQHRRKCSVCHHPERGAIEEAFLHWQKVSNITREFNLPGRTALYRHARALGLFARRSRNLRFALGLIIEQAETVKPTAEAIVHAVRAYTRVTDAGEWVEPPARVIVSSGSAPAGPAAISALASPDLIATQMETADPARIDVPSDQREPRDPSHRPSGLPSSASKPRNLIATQMETAHAATR